MSLSVISFEGPVGVGKTTLGKAVSSRLDFGFIDGDDYAVPGKWLNSILTTSRKIVSACEEQLKFHDAVVMAYPLRCTNWVFYKETFRRRGIAFYCVSLTANVEHIAHRKRVLSSDELARSSEMLKQGYGQRPFSDLVVRTDAGEFDEVCGQLCDKVLGLISEV